MGNIINNIKKLQYYIYLFLFLLIIILIINPKGNFPLNDDWRYASIVKGIAENGKIVVKQTFAPNLLFQLGYGVILVKLFGFSFDILRISTLTILLLFTFIFFKYASSRISNIRFAFFLSILVITTPLFLGLSFSFMTDVPFSVFVFISLIFYQKHYYNRKNSDIILAIIFSLLSFLIRQPAIMLPILYFSMLSFEKKFSRRSLIQLAGISLGIILLYFFIEGFKKITGLTKMYIPVENHYLNLLFKNPIYSLSEVFKQLLKLCITTGLFLIPLLPFYKYKKVKLIHHIFLWGINISILLILIHVGKIFPFGGNYLNRYGFGPALLKDVSILQLNNLPQFPDKFMYFLNYAGQLSFSYHLFFQMTHKNKKKDRPLFQYFIIISMIAYMSIISITSFFDRYMLVPFVMMIFYFIEKNEVFHFSVFKYRFAIILLVPILYFSIAGIHDYMSWQRTKNSLFLELKTEGIGIEEIDAGHEINSWLLADKISKSTKGKSWWYVIDDKYLFSFGDVSGYKEYKSKTYFSWLFLKHQNIFVLSRK